MKILKTLAVFFVLLALTVGAVAEEGFAPYTAEELQAMTITLPIGMDEAVSDTKYSDGLVQIYVDSAKVKWDYVAAQSTEESGAEIVITTVIPEGAKGHRTLMGNAGKLEDMWTFMTNDFNGGVMSSVISEYKPTGRTKIISYSVESNTVTPLPYKLLLMQGWYSVYGNDSSLMGEDKLPRYALYELVYTDDSSVKVEDIGVPSGRITLDTNASEDSYKSSGVAAYKFEQINVSTLTTTIDVPEGAVSVTSEGKELTIEDQKISISMTDIGTEDYYASKTVSLLWYKEDGTVLDAERIVITVEVGNPIVWPNYITDKENFSKAIVNAYFTKDGSKVNTKYMNAVYSDNSGTVTVSANDSIASANEDMTEYGLRVEITPPTNAAYGTSYGTYSANMLGKKPNGYTLSGIWNQSDRLMEVVKDAEPGDEAYVEIVDGKAYFDDILFEETSYSNDPGLLVYYDKNLTKESAATLYMIDWRNENGVAIDREWVAVQYQPMAYSKPVDVVTAAPADVVTPVLIAETAVEDYTLRVRSYPQTSETETQIHYELELLDENGENASLSELNTDVQLLLPYQTAGGKDDNTVVYTVNHYNANGGLKESVTEAEGGVTLERVEGGVLMTIKSLSPFVLSWKNAVCKHDELTYDKSSGNTLVETCKDCDDYKATWTAKLEESYVAGTEISYQVSTEGNVQGQIATAYESEKTNKISADMPTEPGKYYLKVGVEGDNGVTWYLKIPFTVTAAPALPATGDNSLPLIALMGMLALAVTGSFMLRRKANA